MKTKVYLFVAFYAMLRVVAFAQEQLTIPRIDLMPDIPAPYDMRDWKRVAQQYDSLVFSTEWQGEYLPLVALGEQGVNYPEIQPIFMDTYVGSSSHGQQGEAINVIPAIVGASLAGIDKSGSQGGINWVAKAKDYYSLENGQRVYLNNPSARTGHDWWYETMPNVFFYQLYELYPEVDGFPEQFRSVADRWLQAVTAMGGSTSPWTVPYMNYRAWDLEKMQPLNEGVPEPEAAGAIAWILYRAYKELGDKKYLAGAQLAMDFLDQWERNPSYELQLPYGVLTAAQLNAELGTSYDVHKMINWCFDRGDLRGWGSIVGDWNGKSVSGLIGEANDQGNDYAFLMNGFQQAAALVPLMKYDKRYAKAISKWVLNVANASRLFYPGYLEPAHQSDYAWSTAHDPNSMIAYEALKEKWDDLDLYGRGDAKDAGWAATNLGLYGSSHVGYLGAIVQKINVEGVLLLDVNAADFFSERPYPVFAVYNPYQEEKQVVLETGAEAVDLYDAISESVIKSNVSGTTELNLAGGQVLLLVFVPTGSQLVEQEGQLGELKVGDHVVDHHYGYDFSGRFHIRSLSASGTVVEKGITTPVYATLAHVGEIVELDWSVNGVVMEDHDEVLEWAPDSSGTYTIRLEATSEGVSASDSLSLEVVELIPELPVIDSLYAGKRWFRPGETATVVCLAQDPKGLALSYDWELAGSTPVSQGDSLIQVQLPDVPGIYSITCRVSNSADSTTVETLPVIVLDAEQESGEPLVYLPLDGTVRNYGTAAVEIDAEGGSYTPDPRGEEEKALRISSAMHGVTIGNDPVLNFQDRITVSFWLRLTSYAQEQFVISHGSWERRWKVSVIPEKYLRWTLKTDQGTVDLDTSFPLKLDEYYHFTAVYNGFALLLYVNGELDAFTAHSGLINQTDLPVTIGKKEPGDAQYFLRATIDEVRIFNEAVGPEKVKTWKDQWHEAPVLGISGGVKELMLYPNPARGSLFLSSDRKIQEVSVLDISGRLVRKQVPQCLSEGLYVIPVEDLESGLYYLKINVQGRTQTEKVIVE